jgi:hypothetical protein
MADPRRPQSAERCHSLEDREVTRVRSFFILLIFGVTSVVTGAQSRTSDGVSAMLRGDYQQAAAILRPIVEDRQQRDPAAAFFMATLYDTGRGGVPVDPLRACALYQQAFFDANSVYAPTAQMLWRRLWMAHGNDWLQECQFVANIGINHRFQPETFTLGAGHSVEWTLTAATVTYENRAKRTPFGMMGSRGIMFLPVQHIELLTPASPAPLHFFEMFWWEPSAARWTLRALLFEVYRDEVVSMGSIDALPVVTAAEPPALTPADLRTMINLRVNALGAVELTAGGVRPGRRIITTRADKLAALEKERARAAADARIDWNAALDVDRSSGRKVTDPMAGKRRASTASRLSGRCCDDGNGSERRPSGVRPVGPAWLLSRSPGQPGPASRRGSTDAGRSRSLPNGTGAMAEA